MLISLPRATVGLLDVVLPTFSSSTSFGYNSIFTSISCKKRKKQRREKKTGKRLPVSNETQIKTVALYIVSLSRYKTEVKQRFGRLSRRPISRARYASNPHLAGNNEKKEEKTQSKRVVGCSKTKSFDLSSSTVEYLQCFISRYRNLRWIWPVRQSVNEVPPKPKVQSIPEKNNLIYVKQE